MPRVVDQVRRPTSCRGRERSAPDVGEAAGRLVVRVHEDDGDAGRQGGLGLVDEGADLRAGAAMPSAPAAMAALKFSFWTATSFAAKETFTLTPRSVAGLHRQRRSRGSSTDRTARRGSRRRRSGPGLVLRRRRHRHGSDQRQGRQADQDARARAHALLLPGGAAPPRECATVCGSCRCPPTSPRSRVEGLRAP